MREFEMDNFAYLLTDRNFSRRPFIISTYPKEWLEIYTYGHYYLNDPVIRHAFTRVTPFSWQAGERRDLIEYDGEVFHQSSRFKIDAGYTFVVRGGLGEMGALSICRSEKKADFEQNILRRSGDLQMLLLQAHEVASDAFFADDPRVNSIDQYHLSDREKSVVHWAAQGKTYHEIGIILGFKERTIKKYMASVVSKLEVANAKHAISKSIELQLISSRS
ncbi:hypothetical protein A5892_11325 [Halotalea alkalilenta]|uniref:HTH luxR-type domain-containing protein n=2 Tax=Halotalea alkalilenta TaxID=376489 RepID=A0A172YFJ9_9GAMM|nr:hypothetical protein A5892_11325 [Halotalea alkalilenta]